MRKVILFNEGWHFQMPGNGEQSVNLPHTWNGIDGQDGKNDFKRCKCTYKKSFPMPEVEEGGRCIFLFNAVNSEAEVFINGVLVCRHEGGYSAFCADVTDYLREDNLLTVTADNSPNRRVYPQRADFTFYGGIYRDVYMILVPRNHFAFGADCAPPLKITSSVNGKNGSVKAEVHLCGEGEVKISVLDAQDNLVAQGVSGGEIAVPSVRLWNGRKDPYLYKVRAELYTGCKLCDCVEDYTGFRYFRVDTDKGFYLNGEYYILQGCCKHQDWPVVGNAVTREMQEEDIKLLYEMGATSVRLTHYQHDPYVYHLCDKYGIVVSTEIPYISEHMDTGDENAMQQMRELVRQNYNHPSIAFWLLSNEITIKKINEDTIKMHKKLNEFCHSEDPGRITTLTCYMVMNKHKKVAHITDVVSYNLYYGWYIPIYYWAGWTLDSFHRRYPETPVGLAEFGAEAMPNIHSKHPRAMDNSEEFQCIFHEHYIDIVRKRRYIWGTYVWLLADCGSDGRNQGGDAGKNHKGLVTFDRKIRKDAYYLYKAFWLDPEEQKFVHICGQRFKKRWGRTAEIKVYSNTSEVTLYNNGKLIAKKSGTGIFRFRIKLLPDNNIRAVADGCEDLCTFIKVNRPVKEYKLQVKSNGLSWEKVKEKKPKT